MPESGSPLWLDLLNSLVPYTMSLTNGKVVEYMTNELISKYGSDNDITAFVDKYDFYMFPVVNVDGMSPANSDVVQCNTLWHIDLLYWQVSSSLRQVTVCGAKIAKRHQEATALVTTLTATGLTNGVAPVHLQTLVQMTSEAQAKEMHQKPRLFPAFFKTSRTRKASSCTLTTIRIRSYS